MDKVSSFLILLAISCCTTTVRCDNANYTLLVPSQVHAGKTLTSLLTVHYSTSGSVQVSIDLYKTSDLRTSLLPLTKEVTSGLNVVEVDIPSDWSGEYQIQVSNDKFSAAVDFDVKSTPYAILIQTDKPIYKPSQTVNIRVAIIDTNLIPRNETVDVLIEDAEGNKLQQWLDVQAEMGLAQFSLPLSDQPPLGDWKISVSTDVVSQEKIVKIAEYVLPRFEVTVELPSYVLKSAKTISATVSAIYTFGEDVEGTFSIYFESSDGSLRKEDIAISGTTTVDLTLEEVQIIGLRNGLLTATASVYEPLSGETLEGSGSTEIVVSDYAISFMDINSKIYRPSQDYTAYFEVSKSDGTRVVGETNILVVTVDTGAEDKPEDTVEVAVPDSGIVSVTLTMPAVNHWDTVYIRSSLKLESGETVEGPYIGDFSQFTTVTDDIYLQISTDIITVPNVGEVGEISITSSGSSESYFYTVMSKGKVVSSGSGVLSDGQAMFTVTITQDFTPQAYVVVYAVLAGELLADSFSFNIEGTFVNDVTLEFRDSSDSVISQAQPGDDVKVQINTEAGSVVGLLSVDKSVLLLAGGNDITQAQVLTELMALVQTSSSCSDDEDGGFRFFWFPTFGGKSTEDIISAAGMTVATDAELSGCEPDYWILENDIMFDVPLAAAPAPALPDLSVPESGGVTAPKPRQLFPETWLWDLVSSEGESLVLDKTVPDTITTWVATAISMHPTAGIAVTKQSTDLTVKLPFFITPILPYSAKKGEELELKIIVNNYGDTDESCTVVIDGSTEYEVKAGENDLYLAEQKLELTVETIAAGTSSAVIAWLNPLVIDTISLSVSATCVSGVGDAFVRPLLVKPPGYPMEQCESEFVQLSDGDEPITVEFATELIIDYVPESKSVEVQVTGDVMGPSIEGLESLVRVPYGCGEQNMISFTPNIFVRRYLDNVNRLDNDIKSRTTANMESGYQRELTYKHPDGSFSAFGDSDPSGSTWLSAFVMKCFRQASDYITVDSNVMSNVESWLLKQQSKVTVGMFNEPGRVIHTEMQGGSSGGITLTAFVVISFLEDVTGSALDSKISSLADSIAYLEGNLLKIEESPYQLSIITYALQLAKSSQVDLFKAKLERLENDAGGLVWWDPLATKAAAVDSMDYRSYSSGPSSIEMTSYALLTYVAAGDVAKAKKIAMWITKKRGSNGGFQGTQDTVLGLQALAAYAELVVSDSTNLQVSFETDLADTFNHTITASNAIITKKNWFKPAEGIKKVMATISGSGSTIVTTCVGYNVNTKPSTPTTEVTTRVVTFSDNLDQTTLEACIVYTGEGESGMGLTEVKVPTGYSTSVADAQVKTGDAARTESTPEGGLAVYWNSITEKESCVNVLLVKESAVKNVQDAYAVGSQYYNSDTGSRSFYNPTSAVVVAGGLNSAASLSATMSTCIIMLALYFFR